MLKSRRHLVLAAAAVPALACTALLTTAQAAPSVRSDEELSLDEKRALCPLCRPGHPCIQHLM